MQPRKVVQLGKSTLVVSLPKQWVDLHGLEPGRTVHLSMRGDGSLVVYPRELREAERELTINFEKDKRKEVFVREVVSGYLNGASRFRIVSEEVFNAEQQQTVRDIAGKLYLRIMKADSQEFIIESLLDMSKISLHTGMKRMHTIVASMCADMLKALQEENAELAKTIASLDEDVDRFSLLLLRMLRNAAFDPVIAGRIGINLLDCLDYQNFVQQMERVADLAVNISNLLVHQEEKFHPSVLERMVNMGQASYVHFEEAVEAFWGKDTEKANKVLDALGEMEDLNMQVLGEMAKKEKRPFAVCSTCLVRANLMDIYTCGGEIAKTVINHTFGYPLTESPSESSG
ncbi:MAG: phosphate uptake regulator PhoU [Candidatus Hadarchaeales archaeon]